MVSIPESIVSGTPVVTNLIPITTADINKEKLGIAKDKWDENDLVEIIDNNRLYVDNCINYREKLTNSYCAKKITDISQGYNKM
jgi:1,2-diacylglycerol 3-alpha-glucosyltransferase